MTEIQLFTYEPTGDQIQAVMRDGTPWMVAAPVARALAYRDANDMTRTLDEDEKGTHAVRTPGGEQRVIVISEAGLYRVLAQRRAGAVKDPAMRERVEAFQRWVFHTVIPAAVRGEVQPAFRLPQNFAEALRELASTVERAEAAERTAAALEPSADCRQQSPRRGDADRSPEGRCRHQARPGRDGPACCPRPTRCAASSLAASPWARRAWGRLMGGEY